MPQAVEQSFTSWLREEAVELKADGSICALSLLRVLPQDDDSRLSMQLGFDSMSELTEWQDVEMENRLRRVFEKFHGEVLPFATVLQPIDL